MADVPPPPENPFMDNPDPGGFEGNVDALDQGTPNVAAKPGRVLVVVGIVGLILIVLLYSIFSGGKKEEAPVKEKDRPVAAAEPPPLPQTPEPIAPPPAILPPSIPAPASIQLIKPEDDGAAKKQALDRLKSKMLVTDNAGGLTEALTSKDEKKEAPLSDAKGNRAFEASVVSNSTQADKVEATRIADLRRTIAQGRLIQATMESALNTDLPAPIRAIVSLDTYGESGTEPLIPKGSRLIGQYNTDISGGQSRVFVVWTRVIRPDGVDVMIGSPLVDQIGQAGVGGQIDTKFQSIFSRAILSSVVSIGFAIGSDKIGGGSTTTTNSSVGGSSTTGDASTTATVNALNRLGGVSDSFIQRFLNVQPTILVDQGTPVNVFVNRDLIFPASVSSGAKIVN